LFSNRWVLFAVVPLFVFTAVVAFFSVQFAIDERAEQGWVVHTYQVMDRLHNVLSDMQNAETGQRGYLITHQDRFLGPYKAGLARTRSDLDALDALVADNPEQRTRAKALRSLIEARFSALDVTLSRISPQPSVTPQLLGAMDQGRARMDALRAELARGRSAENRLLAQRIATRRLAERNEIIAAGLAALVALLALLATAALLVRSNVRLSSSETKLANESAILQTTLDTIRDGIAMFASDGELCVFNESFFKFLGLSQTLARKGSRLEDFRATNPATISFFEKDQSELDRGFRRLSLNGFELDIYRAPVPTGGFIIVCIDVTARTQAETVARQAQKMEAIGHLTGGVAHDFNNILQVIAANLERVARDLDGDVRSKERVNNAIAAVTTGARLTGQLLAFARRQPLVPRSTNVGRVVQDMTDLLRRTLGESIDVECVIAGGLWNTLIDPSQVENAILNLAINARDAMREGGKLTIEVANAFLDDAYALQHTEVVAGQYVMAAVSDTGSGMSPDTIARAFEPFFTTKPEGRGTGLGLSQVYGFVKQSGGHIKIYSEMGQGTTVKLYLPRTRKPQEATSPEPVQAIQGGNECILVVEDDEAVRNAVCEMVIELGYSVLKAENAEQALAVLGAGTAIDLLFTDVVMPGPTSTREMARRAQELHPNIRVLYTSGYTQNAIVHNGKLDDDVFLLSKPYRRDDLARKIRSLLDSKRTAPVISAASPPETTVVKLQGKVLVVEDIGLIRMTTVDMIEEIGLKTAEAENGKDALEILQSDPDITILLTDLGLPGMTGRQLMEEALRLRPNLKIVIASGYSSEEETGGMPLGVAHLMKPFDMEQLRRALSS
jgi:signal transduction histidine kinase/CheY-like chemotaxis protein/CHASE3 domain sensor protein